MAKFKKYSMKFMCIVSVVFTFMTALFYPIESFKADVISITSGYTYSNFSYENLVGDVYGSGSDQIYINDFVQTKTLQFYNNNGDVYALEFGNYYYVCLIFSCADVFNYVTHTGEIDNSYNDFFERNVNFYLLYNGQRYEFFQQDGLFVCAVNLSGMGTSYFSIIAERDLYYDFNSYQYGNNPVMGTYVWELNLTNISLHINHLTGDDAVDGVFSGINQSIQQGNTISQEILETLQDAFGTTGENEEFTDVPNSEMTDLGTKEDDLLGSTTPDDAAKSIDVTIDADSSAVFWDIINDVVTSNDVVFGGFISLLSLGVIALILNR